MLFFVAKRQSMVLFVAKMTYMRCDPKNEKFAELANPAVYQALILSLLYKHQMKHLQ